MADVEYNGPVAGSTPANSTDLHDSPNPYEQGRTGDVGTVHPTSDGYGGNPLGYWTPPAADADNVFAAGHMSSDSRSQSLTGEMSDSLDVLSSANYGNLNSDANAPDPNTDPDALANYADAGQEDWLVPDNRQS
jgi:hypothetical protein